MQTPSSSHSVWKPDSTSLSRRQFLQRASLAGAAALAPTIIPGSALGLNGTVPPSERIVLGGMGVGDRGTCVLKWMLPEKDVQFVAICDPKKTSREAVKKLVDEQYGNQDLQDVLGHARVPCHADGH